VAETGLNRLKTSDKLSVRHDFNSDKRQGCTLSTSVEEVHDHDKKASKHYGSYWFVRD